MKDFVAELKIREVEGGVIFWVKVVPGSSKTSLSGLLDDMLKIKTSGVPEKGKANQCLLKFLAGQLDVKKNAISIIAGHINTRKSIQVQGLSARMLAKKLNLDKKDSG